MLECILCRLLLIVDFCAVIARGGLCLCHLGVTLDVFYSRILRVGEKSELFQSVPFTDLLNLPITA
jgi:hypothetical protein